MDHEIANPGGARTLTSGANIVLAKGTGVTGFNDLNAAAVQAAAAAAIAAAALATAANLATVDGKADTLLARVLGTLAAGTHQPQSGDAFARVGAAGAGLTALGDTRLAALDAAISSRLAAAGYTAPDNAGIAAIATAVGDLQDLSADDVAAVLATALQTETHAKPGQEEPPEAASIVYVLAYLYKLATNLLTQDANWLRVFNGAGTEVDQKAPVSKDETTFTRGKMVSGP